MFQPKICDHSKQLAGQKGGETSFQALYEEAQSLKDKKQRVAELQRQKQEEKEMEEATF